MLVDFKTDRTPDGPQACAARYCAQLNAYAKALTRIYGAPVKEKILYFFSCDCAYHLDSKRQPANRTFPVCGLNCYSKMHRFPDGLCLILRVKQKRGEKAEDHCGGDAACGSF